MRLLGSLLLAACATAAVSASPELVDAVRANDAPRWQALLAAQTETDARDAAGNTALHFAALHHDVAAVRALLAAGCDPAARNAAGATPLLYGAGHADIVRLLLAAGADANAASEAKQTPLMAAVSHPESFAAVKQLIDAGADVRAVRSPGNEVMLPRAVTAGDRRTIALLIEQGAPINPPTGRAPLQDAVRTGNAELVRQFLDAGANPDFDSGFAGHSINIAFYTQQPRVVPLLVERGASLKTRSNLGPGTPTMVWAAYNNDGDDAAARALVAAGADVNAADDEGATALTYALRVGPDTPLVRYLRSVGATAPAPARTKALPNRPVEPTAAARLAAIRARLPATLALLQRSSATFLENKFVRERKCSSCHQQDVPAVAFDLARRRGLAVDDRELGRMLDARLTMWNASAENARQMTPPLPDYVISLGYGLFGLHALGQPRDDTTDALMHYLLRTQRSDGSWFVSDYRPPMEDGEVVGAGWGAFALRHYAPIGREREVAAASARLAGWLRAHPARTHNDAVFKLLGLAWTGATPDQLRAAAAPLRESQRADGGWAQLPGRGTDAWATGTALFALAESRVLTPEATAYLRGVDFLLRTQFEDGSWWVPTRTWPFQPHFDGRFPHGKDQWISAGATAWAAIALLPLLPAVEAVSVPSARDLLARFRESHPPGAADPAPVVVRALASAPAGTPEFTRDIRPLLERSCGGCHGSEKPKARFSVLSRTTLLQGGASGETAVAPGDPAASVLLAYVTDRVEDLEMPPRDRRDDYPALTAAEVDLLRTWIAGGAPESSDPKQAEPSRVP